MTLQLRIARPVTDLERTAGMYCRGLGLSVLDKFENHAGFDGVMLGWPGSQYHLEFTRSATHPVKPANTPEDLLVFYLPENAEWHAACQRMLAAGFVQVKSLNPYWDTAGRTFVDPDCYRVVLQNAASDHQT